MYTILILPNTKKGVKLHAMKQRRANQIQEALEHAIFVGEFSDGDRLDEVTLSNRFNVSRTPLREAFQALAASGFVELQPGRGAFVRHPSPTELVEMFEVMAEMESFCARLAARRMGPEELQEFRKATDDCDIAREGGDPDVYYWENERFHALLYQASGNSFLASEAAKLHRRLQPFRRLQLRGRGRMNQSMDEHRTILNAIDAGDSNAAAAAARDHVSVQGEKFTDLMSNIARAKEKPAA